MFIFGDKHSSSNKQARPADKKFNYYIIKNRTNEMHVEVKKKMLRLSTFYRNPNIPLRTIK
jgi:hypothetical protein